MITYIIYLESSENIETILPKNFKANSKLISNIKLRQNSNIIDSKCKIEFLEKALEKVSTEYLIFLDDSCSLIGEPKIEGTFDVGISKYISNRIIDFDFDISEITKIDTLGSMIFKTDKIKNVKFEKKFTWIHMLIQLMSQDLEVTKLKYSFCKLNNKYGIFTEDLITPETFYFEMEKMEKLISDNIVSIFNKFLNCYFPNISRDEKCMFEYYTDIKVDSITLGEASEIKTERLDGNFIENRKKINGASNISFNNYDGLPSNLPPIDRNKISNLVLKDEILFLKPLLSESGGTENLINNIALELQNMKICVGGYLSRNGNPYQYTSNVTEVDILKNKSLIQKKLIESKYIIISSMTILPILKKEFLFPRDIRFYFLGEVGDIRGGGIYSHEYIEILSHNHLINYCTTLTKSNSKLCRELFPNAIINELPTLHEFGNYDMIKQSKREKFIYLSRIQVYAKNSLELIEIGRKIKKYGIKIDVYGHGPDEERLINLIKKNKLEKTIIFKGSLNEKKIETIAKYKAMILVSKSEGLPTVFLESFDARTPIICYDNFSSAKDIVNKDTGFLIPSGNRSKFVKTMKKIDKSNVDYFESSMNSQIESLKKIDIIATIKTI